MPTENISPVGSAQAQSILTSDISKDSSDNTAASSDKSFEKILANKTETKDSTDIDTAETTAKKPCIAQLMVMSGCDFNTASKALYQYGNWQDYISDKTIAVPDLSEAQAQLSREVSSGTREFVNGTYGQRNDFVKPQTYSTDNPGKVVPAFDKKGKILGLGIVSATGEQKTIVNLTDNDAILDAVDGFHIGRQALDNFAKEVSGDASSTFSTLNLEQTKINFLCKNDWLKKFGEDNIWNDQETTAKSSDLSTSSTALTSSLISSLSSPTSSSQSYGSILNQASSVTI